MSGDICMESTEPLAVKMTRIFTVVTKPVLGNTRSSGLFQRFLKPYFLRS